MVAGRFFVLVLYFPRYTHCAILMRGGCVEPAHTVCRRSPDESQKQEASMCIALDRRNFTKARICPFQAINQMDWRI